MLPLLLLALPLAPSGSALALPAPAPPALQPSRQFSVTVDGESAFVYLATTDGAQVHNGSFVHIPLHPGASREVVVTLLESGEEGPPKLGALRPDPVGKDGSLPPVKIRAANSRGPGGPTGPLRTPSRTPSLDPLQTGELP
jgi:hypothetical protein